MKGGLRVQEGFQRLKVMGLESVVLYGISKVSPCLYNGSGG